MSKGRRINIFGKTFILDIFVKGGLRRSPGTNARARRIAQCARGEPLAVRKHCFKTGRFVTIKD